jgi:hypothetical protein
MMGAILVMVRIKTVLANESHLFGAYKEMPCNQSLAG